MKGPSIHIPPSLKSAVVCLVMISIIVEEFKGEEKNECEDVEEEEDDDEGSGEDGDDGSDDEEKDGKEEDEGEKDEPWRRWVD